MGGLNGFSIAYFVSLVLGAWWFDGHAPWEGLMVWQSWTRLSNPENAARVLFNILSPNTCASHALCSASPRGCLWSSNFACIRMVHLSRIFLAGHSVQPWHAWRDHEWARWLLGSIICWPGAQCPVVWLGSMLGDLMARRHGWARWLGSPGPDCRMQTLQLLFYLLLEVNENGPVSSFTSDML